MNSEPSAAVETACGSATPRRGAFDRGEAAYQLWQSRSETALQLFGPIPTRQQDLRELAEAHAPHIDLQKRRQVAEVIRESLQELSEQLDAGTERALQKLVDPGTQVVIAGQQPALAGGPLYLLAKLLTTVHLVRALEQQGQSALALFWVADEDHDVGELDSGAGLTAAGLLPPPEIPLSSGRVSISHLRVADEYRDQFSQLLAQSSLDPDSALEVQQLLRRCWDPSPSIAFRKLLRMLLPDSGVLLLTPRPLRALAAPHIAREIGQPSGLRDDVLQQLPHLQEATIATPIAEPAELPFFWIDPEGARHRVRREQDGFRVLDPKQSFFTEQQLLEELQQHPERFSADALLRPLIQDALLQPLITVAGPTEMAYQLELGRAYAPRGIPRPLLWPRLRWRFTRTRDLEKIRGSGYPLEELTADTEFVVTSPQSQQRSTQLQGQGEQLLTELERLLEEAPHLQKKIGRTAKRWQQELERLLEVVRNDFDPQQDRRRQQLQSVHQMMWPGGKPFERKVSLLAFLAHYGLASLQRLRNPDELDILDAHPLIYCVDEAKRGTAP